VDPRKLRDALAYARGTISAGLMQVDSLSPSRLARFGELFTSVTRLAVSGMTAT